MLQALKSQDMYWVLISELLIIAFVNVGAGLPTPV